MRLSELVLELQSMYDKYGDCSVEIANDNSYILDGWSIDRVCFFKDGENQTVIIVENN